jgi:hypothetical protein
LRNLRVLRANKRLSLFLRVGWSVHPSGREPPRPRLPVVVVVVNLAPKIASKRGRYRWRIESDDICAAASNSTAARGAQYLQLKSARGSRLRRSSMNSGTRANGGHGRGFTSWSTSAVMIGFRRAGCCLPAAARSPLQSRAPSQCEPRSRAVSAVALPFPTGSSPSIGANSSGMT